MPPKVGGELLDELSFARLADKRFCAALDDAAHRRALARSSFRPPAPAYVDMRKAASLALGTFQEPSRNLLGTFL